MALEKILNVRLEDQQWIQATLPLNLGGIDIRRFTDVAFPCFISSANSATSLLSVLVPQNIETHDIICSGAFTRFLDMVGFQDEMDQLMLTNQGKLDTIVASSTYTVLARTENKSEKARLLAVAHKESSRWMQAIPSANLGTKLENSDVRIGVSLRLGAPIGIPHKCRCGTEVDTNGRHGLSCRKSAGRHLRHTRINVVFSSALTSAGIPNRREVAGLSGVDNKRPDGKTLVPFSRGRPLVWHASVTHVFASSNVHTACLHAGAAADAAEVGKINKYKELASTNIFMPLAFDTFGVPGSDTTEIIKDVGRRLQKATGEPRVSEYLMQRLSIEIVRGNAVSVLGSFDDASPHLKEIDYLF